MCYSIRVFLVSLFMLFCGATQAAEVQKYWPVIHIENPVFDFGRVPQGELVKHKFTILNEGTAPLEIETVETD